MSLTLTIFPIDLFLPVNRKRQRAAIAQQYDNGVPQLRPRWSRPKVSWDLTLGALTTAERASVNAHFDFVRGIVDPFLLYDKQDCDVANEAVGAGDGATAVFYLKHRNIQDGDSGAPSAITNSTAVIKVEGVVQALGTAYTLDQDQGILTFQAGHIPVRGAAITATYSWYYKVHFTSPELEDTTNHATSHAAKCGMEEYWP